MGRTYEAKNKKAKGNLDCDFDVNYSGADILGYLMRIVKCHSLKIEEMMTKIGCDRPCTKWKMTKLQAERAAKRIGELSFVQKKDLYLMLVEKGLWDKNANIEDFCKFVRQWQEFLDTCGGYEVSS